MIKIQESNYEPTYIYNIMEFYRDKDDDFPGFPEKASDDAVSNMEFVEWQEEQVRSEEEIAEYFHNCISNYYDLIASNGDVEDLTWDANDTYTLDAEYKITYTQFVSVGNGTDEEKEKHMIDEFWLEREEY